MEKGIEFARTILKFTAKSYAPQCTTNYTGFVISAFVLGLELTMDVA